MNQGIDFYNLSQSLAGAIFGAMIKKMDRPSDPPPPLLQFRRGYAEAPAWFLVQAIEFDPEPISVEKLRVRDIYASERIVSSLLTMMATEKWLEPIGHGEFVLTPAGRAIQDDLKARRTAALKQVEIPIETAEIERLHSLLARIIEASLECDPPPDTWCLTYSRNRAPGPNAPILDQILQFTSDFNAFRDDAHMAAWMPLDVSGYAWEAFSFIQSGQADTVEEIDKKLSYRGYFLDEFKDALLDLIARGWLSKAGRAYTLTPAGTKIWETAETLTDQYFYGPWDDLQTAEVLELHRLTVKLQDGLQ